MLHSKPVSDRNRGALCSLALGILRFYQTYFRSWLLADCRFYPTCSEFAVEAFERASFFKALKMTMGRVLRCRPFGPSGFDPVKLEESESCCS